MNSDRQKNSSRTRLDPVLWSAETGQDLAALQARFNEVEPDIQAFIPEPDRFGRLEIDAQQQEAQTPGADHSSPLLGLPVGVKDIFHVEGFETRAGSSLPPGLLQGAEGRAVRRLRSSGALFVGKTVTTEFAYFGPGPTRNPNNLSHTPGGSSSGSAAAVAAGLCSLSLGTQTIGSVIRPAAFCGVLGYKPTFGRIPTSGVIPLSPAYDHVGIFTMDLQLMEAAGQALVSGWKPAGVLADPVLGIPEGPYLEYASSAGRDNFEATVETLIKSGLEVRRVPAFQDFDQMVNRHYLVVAAEAAQVHKDWFAEYPYLYHPRTAELIQKGQTIQMEALVKARSQRADLRTDLKNTMQEDQIDLWITPAAPGTAPEGLDSTGDPVMNLPWTQAGMPAFNIPTGRSAENLPFGLQVVAPFGRDEFLLSHIQNLMGRLKAG